MNQPLRRGCMVALCSLLVSFAFSQPGKKIATTSLPEGISRNWYQQAVNNLEQREYFIKPFSSTNNFAAVNRKQQLGFLFTNSGYTVKRFDFNDQLKSLWEFSFNIKGISRNKGAILLPQQVQSNYSDQQLTYQYNGFKVEYINSKQGMRQNFIVQKKPAGKGDLKVMLQLKGSLTPSLQSPKQLVLKNKKNKTVLYYDDLKAWDANHKPLQAYMELSNEGRSLSLVVNDRNAAYPVTIDPLNYTAEWTDNGNGLVFPLLYDITSPTLYGFSVSGAGDVNNDTYDDIIIGAPAYVEIVSISGGTFNLVSVGAAFIYYGSASGPAANPTEALQPTSAVGALFGYNVSRAGDVNGDGYDDVVIGAPGDQISLTVGLGLQNVSTGKVYVYYGNTFDGNLNTEPVVSVNIQLQQADFGTLAATPANPLYGFSVANAGDVNGDGYADIVVGSPSYLDLLSVSILGRVDVYHGGAAGLSTTPAQKIKGGLLNGLFGYSVSTAGKVNNDSYDDIIAGAPGSISLAAAGSAFIFHGSNTGITATSTTGANTTLQAPGLLTQTLFGFSVSKAGDVNGDGRGDVIIGEPITLELQSLQLVAVGKANIYYGSNSGVQTTGSTVLTSPRRPNLLGLIQGNLLYGYSVSYAGDMNCDGIDDVIVGEPGGTSISLGTGVLGLTSTNTLSGKAYVYYGKQTSGPINSPSWFVQESGSLSAANLLGTSVHDAGDVNGDGVSDLIVGAPNGTLDLASSLTGIIGSAVGVITTGSIGSAYSHFGCFSNKDLDFDNDGIPDAIDLDDDNDGIPDLQEYPGLSLSSDPAADDDGDGIPNYKDTDFTSCGGLNGNGICSAFDKDGDGVPNSFDLDSDNDGILDVIEAGGVDTNGDGILDNFSDTDGDGLSQSVDANNTGASGSGNGLSNPDFDGDGIPNSLDIDSDNDGITDLREAGLPDTNNDGRVDNFTDADGDGYADSLDPKNGHSGSSDPAGSGTPALTTPTDTNSDGRYDGNPTTRNADSDAKFNFIDIDSDNDGITDNVEGQSTAGYVLPGSVDTDGDGLLDTYDSQGGAYTAGGVIPNNHDGTDNPDYLDTNSDNDGTPDVVEGHDLNLNGLPDDLVSLTGLDTDGDGLDDRFDLAVGPNVTTQGMGSPSIPGSVGPLQSTSGGGQDWRNGFYTLPVKLVSFSGKLTGSVVQLDWVTASEINNSYFEILRSADGSDFTSIGRVQAVVNSTGLNNYSFSDNQPVNGKNFYRLKIVSNDNRSEYSPVVLIRKGGDGINGISVYPNPVEDYLQIALKNMISSNYRIDVIRNNGQIVKSMKVAVNSSYQVLMIAKEVNWANGIYMMRVTNLSNKNIFTKSILVK